MPYSQLLLRHLIWKISVGELSQHTIFKLPKQIINHKIKYAISQQQYQK
jgi:hypothetical protein